MYFMIRELQVRICRKCLDSKFVLNEGLICKLSNRKADFENECSSFRRNEKVGGRLNNNSIVLNAVEIKNHLPEEAYAKIFSEQNLFAGLLYGVIASIVGAVLWASITVFSGLQIGYMALAIGALVGYSIKIFGNGFQEIYGIAGALLSLFGCLFGNVLSVVGLVAREQSMDFFNVLFSLNFSIAFDVLMDTFSYIDLLFYGIAIYEGYRFAKRRVTENDLVDILVKG